MNNKQFNYMMDLRERLDSKDDTLRRRSIIESTIFTGLIAALGDTDAAQFGASNISREWPKIEAKLDEIELDQLDVFFNAIQMNNGVTAEVMMKHFKNGLNNSKN